MQEGMANEGSGQAARMEWGTGQGREVIRGWQRVRVSGMVPPCLHFTTGAARPAGQARSEGGREEGEREGRIPNLWQ